jgi:hypothetical protein
MTTEERFTRLEDIMDRLATRALSLDEAMESLAQSLEHLSDTQADQYKRTQQQTRETDARIDKLVSAIGELTRKVQN